MTITTCGAFSGIASATPDLGPLINTTCSYQQVTAALAAENPVALSALNNSPIAQGMLQQFLASPPPVRQSMITELNSSPKGQAAVSQYADSVLSIANTCSNY